MAASTDLTPLPLFYTTGMSTSAAEIYAGPSTAQRAIVTAVYVVNNTTSDADATVTHRMSTGAVDINLLPATTIEAKKSIAFGPIVMSSTTSQQSIRGFGGTAGAIQVVGYGYIEVI